MADFGPIFAKMADFFKFKKLRYLSRLATNKSRVYNFYLKINKNFQK